MNNRVILENNDPFGYSFKVKYRELTGFLHQIPLKSISFVIASAIMLSACGGGGGASETGGSSEIDSPTPTTTTPLTSVIKESSSAAAQGKIAAAAIAEPAAGSVTQSSNKVNGITTDSVSTTVEYQDGQIIYTVTNGAEWDVDSDASDTETLEKGQYTAWNFAELYKELQDGRLWVDVYSNIGRPTTSQEAITATGCGIGDTVSAGETCRYEGGGNNFTFTVKANGQGCWGGICAGTGLTLNNFMASKSNGVWTINSLPTGAMPVAGGTQTISVPDTDFLAGGIWVYVPDDATSVDDFTFGAFVHGEDPYNQSNLIGLTGEYTYTGDATGVYSVLADERNYFFDADVTLTADFDDGANLGTIGGHIDNVWVDDELVEGDPTLNLGTADIGGDNSGFFTGDTDMVYEGENYTGKWGGQFFGNDDTNPPGSVAGTFGAATSDGANSVLGVYGAGSPTPVSN